MEQSNYVTVTAQENLPQTASDAAAAAAAVRNMSISA